MLHGLKARIARGFWVGKQDTGYGAVFLRKFPLQKILLISEGWMDGYDP